MTSRLVAAVKYNQVRDGISRKPLFLRSPIQSFRLVPAVKCDNGYKVQLSIELGQPAGPPRVDAPSGALVVRLRRQAWPLILA